MKPRDPKQTTEGTETNRNVPGTDQNEGEGSRSADRHYREGVEKTVQSGRVEELGEEAKEALEGDEGEDLRRAEEEAKQHGENVPEHVDGQNEPKKIPRGRPAQGI